MIGNLIQGLSRKSRTTPSAIVLARSVTGLDVVRSLGQVRIPVHAVYFRRNDPVRLSRYCSTSFFDESRSDSDEVLILEVLRLARKLGNRPLLIPTSDSDALMIAKNASLLSDSCRLLVAPIEELIEVVSKERLYAHAQAAGLDTVPAVIAPKPAEVAEWSQAHCSPYLVKPFYVGVPGARMKEKNLIIPSREELLTYVDNNCMDSLIVQQLLRGGDGYIFDCYGYCGADGSVMAMATKRRWRQNPPDFGTCCMGEIPASLDGKDIDGILKAKTRRLFSKIHYQGIFGVEWLFDQETRRFYLIDLNARPFMSIAHVAAAGLNLPAIAYLDLIGESPLVHRPRRRLKHIFGVDLLRDMGSLIVKQEHGGVIGYWEWLRSIIACRYFYYASWWDPLPGIARLGELPGYCWRYVFHCLRSSST